MKYLVEQELHFGLSVLSCEEATKALIYAPCGIQKLACLLSLLGFWACGWTRLGTMRIISSLGL
ncbi:hypothetical protein BVRB_3g058230 [Beta vulgaris subsp. vulgaris]|nr:hypothetical protein BVRB_3g058230 [Beta vulgaris subsp. vulgaris]